MLHNVEIKAKCSHQEQVREYLLTRNAFFQGVDHQVDTYFKVREGRLKLREGNIENNLIFYKRENKAGPKRSEIILYSVEDPIPLKAILSHSIGVLTVVDKVREIYFLDNVKFHIDQVNNLGAFIEIEAIDVSGHRTEAELLTQCKHFMIAFAVEEKDLISVSYSDMLLKN